MNESPLIIKPPTQVRARNLFWVVAPLATVGAIACWLTQQPTEVQAFFAGAVLLFGLFAFEEYRSNARKVIIYPVSQLIEVYELNVYLKIRLLRYDTSQFRSVVSYYTKDRSPPTTRADLLLENEREGLMLTWSYQVFVRRGFFGVPSHEEHPLVTRARQQVATALRIPDQGFVGYRKPARQAAANAA